MYCVGCLILDQKGPDSPGILQILNKSILQITIGQRGAQFPRWFRLIMKMRKVTKIILKPGK